MAQSQRKERYLSFAAFGNPTHESGPKLASFLNTFWPRGFLGWMCPGGGWFAVGYRLSVSLGRSRHGAGPGARR